MPNCIACGHPLAEDDLFCGKCGKKQTATPRKSRCRANGEGSVYRYRAGWRCQVVLGYKMIDGKARAITRTKAGFKTKREALEYLPQLRQEPSARTMPTLSALWEEYQAGAYAKLSPSRQEKYRIAWPKLSPLHFCRVDLLTTADLQRTVSAGATTYYPARDMRDLLSLLFQLALANRYVSVNLANYITLPTLEEKEQQPFTVDEISALWADYAAGNRWTGYILLLCYTGMMPGELLAAQKSSVDLTAHTITGAGLKTKTRKKKPIILADAILPVLAALMDDCPGDKLIRINKDNFYTRYYETLARAGVRKLPPYSCRHTTASVLAGAKIPNNLLQAIMRHANFSTTERYIHATVDQELQAANIGTAAISTGL